MADCRVRRRKADGSLQHPVAFIACNFTPPVGSAPRLLTHDEVTTLFHEFGHALHHMLTAVEVSDVIQHRIPRPRHVSAAHLQ